MTYTEYQAKVKEILRDDASVLRDPSIISSIDDALPVYSRNKPQKKVFDIIGDNGYSYDLPYDWVPEFSQINTIEYPSGEQIPVYIESEDWLVYDAGTNKVKHGAVTGGPFQVDDIITGSASAATGIVVAVGSDYLEYTPTVGVFKNGETITGGTSAATATVVSALRLERLRFLIHTPSLSETIRITYAMPYSRASIELIPPNHEIAFSYLAAAMAALTLSRHYTQNMDSDIEADSVDYQDESGKWAERAKELKKIYYKMIGMGSDKTTIAAASKTGDWDTNYSWGGDYLFHRKKWR